MAENAQRAQAVGAAAAARLLIQLRRLVRILLDAVAELVAQAQQVLRAGVALVPAEWKLGMELVYLLVSPSLSLEA